jgi:hypothetical protein
MQACKQWPTPDSNLGPALKWVLIEGLLFELKDCLISPEYPTIPPTLFFSDDDFSCRNFPKPIHFGIFIPILKNPRPAHGADAGT